MSCKGFRRRMRRCARPLPAVTWSAHCWTGCHLASDSPTSCEERCDSWAGPPTTLQRSAARYRPPGPYLRGTVLPNPDIVQMHLTVSNYAYPEQTPRSTQAPGREVLTINGQVADLIHQSNGLDTVHWQIARGIQVELTGQADVVGAGIVALAQRVRPVTADDPRLRPRPYVVPFCLQTSPPVIQGGQHSLAALVSAGVYGLRHVHT